MAAAVAAVCPSCGGKVVPRTTTPSGLMLRGDQQSEGCESCGWARVWREQEEEAEAEPPIAGQKSMCGGCSGSGRIVNPNNGRVERHEVCNGEGVRA